MDSAIHRPDERISVEFGDNDMVYTKKADCRRCMTFSFQSNVSMRRYVLKVRAIDCILFECVHVCVHVGGMYAYLCICAKARGRRRVSTPVIPDSLETGSSIEPGT